jgi:hypothetical protein
MAYFKVLSQHSLGRPKENHEEALDSAPAEVRTDHLPNTNLETLTAWVSMTGIWDGYLVQHIWLSLKLNTCCLYRHGSSDGGGVHCKIVNVVHVSIHFVSSAYETSAICAAMCCTSSSYDE